MNVARDALRRVIAGHELDAATMAEVVGALLRGELTPVLIAALASALGTRGETDEELAAAARAVRAAGASIDFGEGPLLDTCGTGGDGASTFNISTVSAIVAAGAGARVAKHGNRAVTSRSGSADVLEALGLRLDLDEATQRRCLNEAGIAFLFAPAHHAALRHAASARKELGVRTFFNLLGPLVNPAGATHQLMGVYEERRVAQAASVLARLGVEKAWVVHHESGLDEIGTEGASFVAEARPGAEPRVFRVGPEDFGVEAQPLSSLQGGDAATNARICERILAGERTGADAGPRTAVVLNAAAAIMVLGLENTLPEAAQRARDSIDEGRAAAVLERWRELSA